MQKITMSNGILSITAGDKPVSIVFDGNPTEQDISQHQIEVGELRKQIDKLEKAGRQKDADIATLKNIVESRRRMSQKMIIASTNPECWKLAFEMLGRDIDRSDEAFERAFEGAIFEHTDRLHEYPRVCPKLKKAARGKK